MLSTLLRGRLTLLAALSLVALVGARSGAQALRYVPGEVLVGVADGVNMTAAVPMLERNVGFVAGSDDHLHAYRMILNGGVSISAAIARLKHQPGVLYAEPNYIRHTCATPNDTYFNSNQYGPQIVNATGAWSLWVPQRQVVIAIVDTGVLNTHEDLTNKILRDASGIVGYNAFTGQRADANDDYGHGTHCAGITAAQVNNGTGVAGIAGWNGSPKSDISYVKIMPVKVLDNNGSGSDDTVAAGVRWAADHGANVISMSLGESEYSYTLDTAVQYAYSKGVVVVAAAGNNGTSAPFYPAANANVISVAATDGADNIASFSNYGSWVTVAAPGVNIFSTLNSGAYGYSSGTSMACPHVAGEAALLLAQNASLTNDQASYLIRNNVNTYTGNGRYVLYGRINVGNAIANIGSVPAANPGSATFVKLDTATHGNWKGVYGVQGYDVIQDSASLPASVKESGTGEIPYTWNSAPSDAPSLQRGGPGRIAACSYNFGIVIRDVNLTDGQTHQVSLYCVDYDSTVRTQTIDVLDADTNAVLNTQNLSSFQNGAYVVWNIKGHVKFRLTNTNLDNGNAVLSGLFFDAQGGSIGVVGNAASFVKTDYSTKGSWKGVYGVSGYNVINNASSYPSYANVASSGNANWTWAASTTNPVALQKAGAATDRIAACSYSASSFLVDMNLTDGQTHQVSLYCVDYDQNQRTQTIDVLDADTNAVLNTQNLSSFQNGAYVVWNIKGHVKFRLTNTAGSVGVNAVLSGLFFDAQGTTGGGVVSNTAGYVKTDTSTSGSWIGKYGTAGYNVINNASSYPSYANVASSGNANWTWAASTTNPVALQKAGAATDRIAACSYSASSFLVDMNLTDGQTHQVSLYCVDYDQNQRTQTIDVLDADTNAVLNTQNLSSFQNGAYVVWNIKGHVKFRLTNTAGSVGVNAVLSGLFFD